jgi:hypothetical protein
MGTIETVKDFVREDFVERSREAESLLVEVAKEGRNDFLVSERAFLVREMGWDVEEQKRQLRRVKTILRLQAIAGTSEDREAALKECQVSTDLLAKEEPKILEQIAKLESKLAGLKRDASTAQKRVEQQGEAVQQLRTRCPEDIKETVKLAVKVVEDGIGHQLRDAKARHHELRCILNIDNVYESAEKHIEYGLRRLLPEAVQTATEGRMMRYGYSAEWPMLKSQCQLEYAALCQQVPELQAEYDTAIERAELSLGFYAN